MEKKGRLFVIADYKQEVNLRTYDFNEDIRVKILGEPKKYIWNNAKKRKVPGNDELFYIGGLHRIYRMMRHRKFPRDSAIIMEAFREEMSIIKESDFVLAVITEDTDIYTILRLFYAATLNKEIMAFVNINLYDEDNHHKWNYFLNMCKAFDNNMKTLNYNKESEILEYIKKLEITPITHPFKMNYSPLRILEEARVFVSSNFKVSHRNMNYKTAADMLKKDFRAKLFSESEKLVFEARNLRIMYSKDIKYSGSYYYYYIDRDDTIRDRKVLDYRFATIPYMNSIRMSDAVFIILDSRDSTLQIVDLLYSVFLKKKIFVFYNPLVMGQDFKSSFYFALEFAKEFDADMTVHKHVNYDEIITMIEGIKKHLPPLIELGPEKPMIVLPADPKLERLKIRKRRERRRIRKQMQK